ncbi:MAG: STAS domain-containing protein [Acidobacteriota bacterium]|nr:STAS domain-containing protein [Acidobacteriota bacterium]
MSSPAASPSFSLDVDLNLERAVVHCHGRMVGYATSELTAAVRPLVKSCKRVVLDLTDLTHMDSLALGTIVRLYVSAKTNGSCLELINLTPRIRQLLGITNLLSVLTDLCESGVMVRF